MSYEAIRDSFDLEQEEYVLLFEVITLNGQVLRLTNKAPTTYLGVEYAYLQNKITGLKQLTSTEAVRPEWVILNPNRIFTKLALDGYLEGSTVQLIRIKADEFESGVINNVLVDTWKIYKLNSVNTSVAVELRQISDFPSGKFPYRGYYPPEFTQVNIV